VYTSDINKAYDFLGGQDKVHTEIERDSTILCGRFNDTSIEPSRKGLDSTLINTNEILLKIKRKKINNNNNNNSSSSSSSSNDVKIEVVGKIIKTYVFNNTADYQFLPSSSSLDPITLGISTTSSSSSSSSSNIIIETVPRTFQRTIDNIPEVFYDTKNSINNEGHVRKKKVSTLQSIRFNDDIPSTSINNDDHDPINRKNSTLVSKTEILSKLSKFLASRPLLRRSSLEKLEFFKAKISLLFEAYTDIGYTFCDGVFKDFIIRLGYDPRINPDTRYLQILTMKFHRDEVLSIIKSLTDHMNGVTNDKEVDLDKMIVYNKRSKTNNHDMVITVFGAKVSMSLVTKMQLCHIHDDRFHKFMSTVKRTSSCGKKYGWYQKSTLEEMKKIIIDIIFERYLYAHHYHYHYHNYTFIGSRYFVQSLVCQYLLKTKLVVLLSLMMRLIHFSMIVTIVFWQYLIMLKI